jgi:MTH538 TIR-like domain (DUF1863)
MSYRNKTYVIFDGDADRWAYAFMNGWKSNENMDFNFHDAHDIGPLTERASDDTIKARLRERLSNAKQAVVLVGENTKNLRKWVPWEIEISQKLDIPIIVSNLNGKRQMDPDRCPAGLRDWVAAHVSFKAKIIQHALDNFPDEYRRIQASASGFRYYSDDVYKSLGL